MDRSVGSRILASLKAIPIVAATALEQLTDHPYIFLSRVLKVIPESLSHRVSRAMSKCLGSRQPAFKALDLLNRGNKRALEALFDAYVRSASDAQKVSLSELALAAGSSDIARQLLNDTSIPKPAHARAKARLHLHDGDFEKAIDVLAPFRDGASRRLLARTQDEFGLFRGDAQVNLPPQSNFAPKHGTVLHILTNSRPYTQSGYAERSHEILKAQVSLGYEVHALTRLGYPWTIGKLPKSRHDVIDGVHYWRLLPAIMPSTHVGRLAKQARMAQKLAVKIRPFHVHTTSHFPNAVVAGALARSLGVPWTYEVRGFLADTWAAARGEEAYTSTRYALFQLREKQACLDANQVVTLGSAMKDHIASWGVPKSKITIGRNAVSEQLLSAAFARDGRATPFDDEEGTVLIGTISSLVAYEGIEALVRSFATLAAREPRARLVIAGSGIELESLRTLARELGILNKAWFPGKIPKSEAEGLYGKIDVFVVPRLNTRVTQRVTPMKAIEALAAGCVGVFSDLPALREIEEFSDRPVFYVEEPENLTRSIEEAIGALTGTIRQPSTKVAKLTWVDLARALGAAYERLPA